MSCNEALRVHAYCDGELDAAAAADIEHHLETCPDCASLLKDIEETRSALRRDATYYRASEELRARIGDARDDEEGKFLRRRSVWKTRPFLTGAVGGSGITALAAAFVFFLLVQPSPNLLVEDLTNAHLRSMMSAHVIDVASSDRHTVKPWFAGHTDVSPPAVNFAPRGFTLVGGRADYIDGHRAAVVVYRHGKHTINVFAWAAGNEQLPQTAERNGYHLLFWRSGNLAFCAVSDAGLEEMKTLAQLIQNAGAPATRE